MTESFYQGIGVAPVQFVFEATIKSGKIKSIIAYLPAGQIARISKACRAQAKEPLIHGRPCSEFVQLCSGCQRRLSASCFRSLKSLSAVPYTSAASDRSFVAQMILRAVFHTAPLFSNQFWAARLLCRQSEAPNVIGE